MSKRIIKLYEQMSELTKPECASSCKIPHSCCDRLYCEIAKEYAKSKGVELIPLSEHQALPFMGPEGCVVAPWLRPMCTMHTCAINNIGHKPHDPAWTTKYFRLRLKIEHAEEKEATKSKPK